MANNNTPIQPTPGSLLVEDLEPETEKKITDSGNLQIAGGNAHDNLKLGRVVTVGDEPLHKSGNDYVKSPAQENHIVAYQSLASHNIRIGGVQYHIVEFEHIKGNLGAVKNGS